MEEVDWDNNDFWDTAMTAARMPTADVTQLHQDTRKISPYYIDTLEIHPDARVTSQTVLQETAAATAGTSTTEDNSWLGKLYDVGNWAWGLVFPQSNIEQTDQQLHNSAQQISEQQATTRQPQQMTEKEFRHFVNEMRHLVRRIQDFNEEFSDDLSFEALLTEIFKAQIKDREDEASIHYESIGRDLQQKRALNRDRLEKMDELINSGINTKRWGQFEKLVSGLGIAAVGLSAPTGVGLVVFLVAVGMTADSMFDDYAKRKIAGLVSGDDKEKTEKYTEYLKLGAGIASIGVFMGMTGPGAALNTMINIAKGSSTIGQGYAKHRNNVGHASMKELGHEIDKKGEQLKRDTKKITGLVENVHQYYQNVAEICQNHQEAFTQVARK